ncbi:MAG: hypothetical protein ACREPY_11980 [Rhodanobacteraceae bacterium]
MTTPFGTKGGAKRTRAGARAPQARGDGFREERKAIPLNPPSQAKGEDKLALPAKGEDKLSLPAKGEDKRPFMQKGKNSSWE